MNHLGSVNRTSGGGPEKQLFSPSGIKALCSLYVLLIQLVLWNGLARFDVGDLGTARKRASVNHVQVVYSNELEEMGRRTRWMIVPYNDDSSRIVCGYPDLHDSSDPTTLQLTSHEFAVRDTFGIVFWRIRLLEVDENILSNLKIWNLSALALIDLAIDELTVP